MSERPWIAGYIWCGECGKSADWTAWVQLNDDGDYWLFRRMPGYQAFKKSTDPVLHRYTISANLSQLWSSEWLQARVGELPVTCRVHGEKPLDLAALEKVIKTRRPTRPAHFTV